MALSSDALSAPLKLGDLLAKRERVHDNILTHKWRKSTRATRLAIVSKTC